MRKFIVYIFSWGFAVIIILEIILRVFGLAAHTMKTANVDGNYLFEPGDAGYWVRGGLAEIRSTYEINNQGYNSIIDYDSLNPDNLNIALIGDSYIQGFQTDVEKSIGRQLENIAGEGIVVHEYGRAGASIVDYSLAYQDYVLPKGYDMTFILITDKDLSLSKASYMGRGDRIPNKGLARKIYDNVHMLRYLNINHGLGVHIRELIKDGPESIERIHGQQKNVSIDPETYKEQYLQSINREALSAFRNDVVFLFEDNRLDSLFIENFDFEFTRVEHIKLPKDHGLDGHWNENGRYNCAYAMLNRIRNS